MGALWRWVGQWLMDAARDENSWLYQVATWMQRASEIDGTIPMVIVLAAVSAMAVALLWWLWKTRKPAAVRWRSTDSASWAETGHGELPADLTTLPPRDQPPALFLHACEQLAERQLLNLSIAGTNGQLVSAARVPSTARTSLRSLADGADRALFGNWQPDANALQTLRSSYRQLFAELASS